MVEIIPAILTSDIREIQEKIAVAEEVVKRVQIDIIDGQFAQNKTVDPSAIEVVDTEIQLDFHLMTKEPIDWVERSARGGADRIIGQIEMMSDQVAFLGKVQELGLSVGLAIDLKTEISSLDATILGNVDVILVMAVEAGFGGQKFDPKVLAKINKLAKIRAKGGARFRICVDGGETENTVDETRFSGADEIVVGARIFQGDLAENIKKFEEAAHNGR